MSASPSITVPADATFNMHGHSTATISLPVVDSGRTPIIVTGRVASISPKAMAHPALSWVTSVGPHGLHLAPGQAGVLTLTIKVPAGVTGTHYVNVIAGAAPLGHHGLAAEAAAVGGTLKITNPGSVPVVTPHHAAQGPASGGSDAGWLVLAVVLVLALALAGLAMILRRRHGAHR